MDLHPGGLRASVIAATQHLHIGPAGQYGPCRLGVGDLLRQHQRFTESASREVDIVVTTALVAGKKAPLLVTEDMVKAID